ncbi:sigma-70 family RNA polymerase sigma factor [soil metagenome]
MTARLMTRFRRGDPEAVRVLYQRYGKAVFTVALRSLGDRSLAEEAVQQTFVNAWRASPRFDPERDPAPWLYAIVRRVAVDVYRRERRHREGRTDEADIAVLPPSFEGLWELWEVRSAVDELPPDERAVIEATFYRDLSHTEAAQQPGIPVGTVKSRSHRAYQRLAGLLEHLGEESA